MRLEEVLPAFRNGKRIRRSVWHEKMSIRLDEDGYAYAAPILDVKKDALIIIPIKNVITPDILTVDDWMVVE
jgi:hypothetical protein